jgi:predicted outer membrane protein
LNFKREIDGHLVALIEQKLGQEKGQQFDRCFMRGQVVGHVHMLASLQVAANQASPRLKPILDEAIQVAQQHLSQAESLAKKLESREVRDQ